MAGWKEWTIVPCPTCGAPVGEKCKTASGKVADMAHMSRFEDMKRARQSKPTGALTGDYGEELGLGANRAVFDPIEARFGRAPTLDEIIRANAAVMFNMNDDYTAKWGPAQGYACALTAIMQAVASVGRNPEGENREGGLRAEHEHAVPKADAHTQSAIK